MNGQEFCLFNRVCGNLSDSEPLCLNFNMVSEPYVDLMREVLGRREVTLCSDFLLSYSYWSSVWSLDVPLLLVLSILLVSKTNFLWFIVWIWFLPFGWCFLTSAIGLPHKKWVRFLFGCFPLAKVFLLCLLVSFAVSALFMIHFAFWLTLSCTSASTES